MNAGRPGPEPDLERLLDGEPEVLSEALGGGPEAAAQRSVHLALRAAYGPRSRPRLPAEFEARLERHLAARRALAPRRVLAPAARLLLVLYWLAAAVATVLLLAARIDLPIVGTRLLELGAHWAPRLVPGSVSDLALVQLALLASLLAIFAPSVLGAVIRRLLRPFLA